MDELTLLRNARSNVENPSAEALTAGRAALFNEIAGNAAHAPMSAGRRRMRRVGFAGLGTLGAAGLVAALALTDVIGLGGWRGGADPAAAAVLHQAAASAIRTSDPVVGPGQYLEIATSEVGLVDANGELYLSKSTDQLYLPADLTHGDWVWVRDNSVPVQTFGPASEAQAAKDLAAREKQWGDEPERLRARGGRFYSAAPSVDPTRLALLSRDPDRLLNYIYRVTLGSGPSPDGEALVWIADTLRSGVVPADLRAALFEAAAKIPGVGVVDNGANLDGRVGISIGRVESTTNIRQEIIVDPDTGQLIGERQVALSPMNGLPAGTVYGWTSVVTSVVDAAPAGGTQNGAFDVMGCTTDNGHSVCPPGK